MKYEHLNFEEDGIQVLIPFSKTDQKGEGRMIYLPKIGDNYCPVKALKDWLEVALIDQGPLFYKINKANNIEKYILNNKNQKVSLTDTSFVLILKKRAREANLDNCDNISGHSLRIGSITQARMNGVPTHEIMAQSGHKTTQMIDRYTKLSNIKENSASKNLMSKKIKYQKDKKNIEDQYNKYVYPKPVSDINLEIINKKIASLADPNYSWHLLWPEKEHQSSKLKILIAGCGSDQAAILAMCNSKHNFYGIDLSKKV